ncbi:MAG: DUF72 domain-containing protein, partial [Deltaproteobacteria bacterium]
KMGPRDFLGYYTEHFHTTEINNSFYQLPKEKTLVEWRDTVPGNFIFAAKASRYITHMKKLKDPEEGLSRFLSRIDKLGDKLGPILFQLPPRWHCNVDRLTSFLDALPDGYRFAFEFRDESWFHSRVNDALTRRGVAFCIYDFDQRLSPKDVTADFVYVRLHGPGPRYQGQYDTEVLTGWAREFSRWSGAGKEIYCYFDNDQNGYAARDALRLQEIVSGKSLT